MKTEVTENKWGLSIEVIPETTQEVAQLLRFANNAKAEKPSVYFSFSSDSPYLNIHMSKIKESVQKNSISR